ncbi:MAG: hypothetical protein WDN04_21405 [Rhodospirillales bacterium]
MTMVLSNLLRYHLDFDLWFGRWGAAAAFAGAALTVSLVSYSLNARYIFRRRPATAAKADSRCLRPRSGCYRCRPICCWWR